MKQKHGYSLPQRVIPVWRLLGGLGLLWMLAGCASMGDGFGTSPGFGDRPFSASETSRWSLLSDADQNAVLAGSEVSVPEPIIVRGTDRLVGQPAARPGFTLTGEAVALRFEQAPVEDVVHAILGDILGLPYIISAAVSGTVTVRTADPVPREQMLALLESLLAANGLALVQDQNQVLHVGTPDDLRDIAPVLELPNRAAPGRRLVIVPLRYIGANEMADLLRPVARPEALVRVDGARNLLILSGTAAQVEGWLDIVRIFDVDVLQGLSVGLFPLRHISVAEIEAALAVLTGASGTAAPLNTDTESAGMPSLLGSVVRIVGLERLNAVLVVTPRAHYLEQATQWIERLDVPLYTIDEPRLFVYPVRNGNAAHLAGLVHALFGDAPALLTPQQRDTGVAPGLETGRVATQPQPTGQAQDNQADSPATATGLAGNQPGVAAGDNAGFSMRQAVRVIADEHNNAILVLATGPDYQKIESALKQLDRQPTQVLIEASIIEVTLTDDLQYGLQWFFQGGIGGSRYSGEGRLNLRTEGGIGPAQPSFSYTVRNPIGDVRAVLNALADRALVRVISSPSILVLDNHTATITVGDQQPVRSSTTITEGGVTTSSIQFKDTGVQLEVTPSINAGGMVTLDISQTVTDVGGIDAATDQRTFLQRHIASKVAARSGESIVLGGLIRDNDSSGRQGVPGLHDVPLFGNLFGRTARSRARTELLVVLTPQVLESEADLRGIGDELRRKMQRVDNLLQEMNASQ